MNITKNEEKLHIKLRPYQKECIETVNNLPDGAKTIVCLATGLGKTVTAANFEAKGRILWISHRDELVRQPRKYFEANGMTYGIEKGSERANDEIVVSASTPTLAKDKRLERYKPDDFDLIICDEAQHAAAETYRKILGYFKPRKLIGLTATPKRGDGIRLSDIFDDICFVRDLKWGIENGYLSRIRCVRVSATFDFKKIKTAMGDFQVTGLSKQLLLSNDDLVVTQAYVDYCLPEHKKTLIYCPTIDVCNKVITTMKEAVPESEKDRIVILSDKNTPEERRHILENYQEDNGINCIINCMILTEGTDLPKTSVIINNRPTANSSLYQQIIGRGTRLSEGKEYCLIVDVVGENSKERKICTAPTLFGLDPDELPEKITKDLEKGDLLDLVEELKSGRSKLLKSVTLKKELVDIFTGDRIGVITANAEKGFVQIAKEYEKLLKEEEIDLDFGDIMVKLQPEEEKHYGIQASYSGKIYVSKPDMLDRCIITIDIPAKESPDGQKWDAISKPMPSQSAIDMVTDILNYSIASKYAVKWSKQARSNMSRSHITEKQKTYISGLYDNYTDKEIADRDKLNKLQANDLIELHYEIGALKETSRRLGSQKKEQEKEDEKKFKERNAQYKKIVLYTYNRKKGVMNKVEKLAKDDNEFSVNVICAGDYNALSIRKATVKQQQYINLLSQTLKDNRKILDVDLAKLNTDMWRTGVIIDCLKALNALEIPPEGYEYRVRMIRFLKEMNKAAETKPYPVKTNIRIPCSYMIKTQRPEFTEV